MILSPETKHKFNEAMSKVNDGWSLQYALKTSGLSAYNEKNKAIRKTNEFKQIKDRYMQMKFNKGEQNGLME